MAPVRLELKRESVGLEPMVAGVDRVPADAAMQPAATTVAAAKESTTARAKHWKIEVDRTCRSTCASRC